MKRLTRIAQELKRWRYAALGGMLAVGLLAAGIAAPASAATQQLYVTPASTTTNVGKTFTVSIRLNPGRATDAVEATINYNAKYLQYVSVDATSSGFPIELPTSATSGSVTITRGIFSSTVSSDVLVAKVSFKALARNSSANLKLTGNATYQGAYVNPTVGSATVRIRS